MHLLHEESDFYFLTIKWNIAIDQSNTNYDEENEIICNTEVLKRNLCDFNDASILVKGNITDNEDNNNFRSFK